MAKSKKKVAKKKAAKPKQVQSSEVFTPIETLSLDENDIDRLFYELEVEHSPTQCIEGCHDPCINDYKVAELGLRVDDIYGCPYGPNCPECADEELTVRIGFYLRPGGEPIFAYVPVADRWVLGDIVMREELPYEVRQLSMDPEVDDPYFIITGVGREGADVVVHLN